MEILKAENTYSREAVLQSKIDSIKSEIKSQKIKVMLDDDNKIGSQSEESKLDELRARYLSLLGQLNTARSRNNKAARDVIFNNYSRKNPQIGRVLNPTAYDRINPDMSVPLGERIKKFEDFKDPVNEIAELMQKTNFTYRTTQIDVVTY
jgi:hypothetical protein